MEAVNAETPLELLTDYMTPNELFFVRSHWIPRTPDPKRWKFTVDGEVERPLQFTLSDPKKLPRTEATCVLAVCRQRTRALFAGASRRSDDCAVADEAPSENANVISHDHQSYAGRLQGCAREQATLRSGFRSPRIQ